MTIRKFTRTKSWITVRLWGVKDPVHVSRATYEEWIQHQDRFEEPMQYYWMQPSERINGDLLIYIQYNEIVGSFRKITNDPVVRARYDRVQKTA